MSNETKGMLYGFVGICAFGLTLPVTKLSIPFLDPVFIGLGRAVFAAFFAALLLIIYRQPIPTKSQFYKISVVAIGVVVGFPVFSSIAMVYVPASHGGVIAGVLPLLTAIVGFLIGQERPSIGFWIVSAFGSGLVVLYALFQGAGQFHMGDFALLFAVVSAAVGYAVGGKLSKELGGWQVICWALLVAFPFIIIPVFIYSPDSLSNIPVSIYSSFIYLVLVSQLFAFFVWYKGLAMAGIARVSQTQLLQPFVTLFASALLLNEVIDSVMIIFSILIVMTVWLGKKMPILVHLRSEGRE